MNLQEISREVDANYDFFQRQLADHIESHRGEFALIRRRKIIGFFDDAQSAEERGVACYPDQIFSIQEVTDEPIDLGFYSYAAN